MHEKSKKFDSKNYNSQKTLQILNKNGGNKLTVETLDLLERAGLRLVPPKIA
jgi:hypothetical protein